MTDEKQSVTGKDRVWMKAKEHVAVESRIGEQGCVGPELPGGNCQAYVTGSNSASHQNSCEKCFDECRGNMKVGLYQMYRLRMPMPKNENLATQITTSKSKRKLQIARGVNPIEPKIGMRILWGEGGVLPSVGVSEWVASGNEG